MNIKKENKITLCLATGTCNIYNTPLETSRAHHLVLKTEAVLFFKWTFNCKENCVQAKTGLATATTRYTYCLCFLFLAKDITSPQVFHLIRTSRSPSVLQTPIATRTIINATSKYYCSHKDEDVHLLHTCRENLELAAQTRIAPLLQGNIAVTPLLIRRQQQGSKP